MKIMLYKGEGDKVTTLFRFITVHNHVGYFTVSTTFSGNAQCSHPLTSLRRLERLFSLVASHPLPSLGDGPKPARASILVYIPVLTETLRSFLGPCATIDTGAQLLADQRVVGVTGVFGARGVSGAVVDQSQLAVRNVLQRPALDNCGQANGSGQVRSGQVRPREAYIGQNSRRYKRRRLQLLIQSIITT